MRLLESIRDEAKLQNDGQLAEFLGVSPPVISRIRTGKCRVSADIMIRIHEKFGWPISEIKALCSNQD